MIVSPGFHLHFLELQSKLLKRGYTGDYPGSVIGIIKGILGAVTQTFTHRMFAPQFSNSQGPMV